MRTIRNPSQISLFDPLAQLPKAHIQSFLEGPEGVIRAAILEALPVDKLAEKFCGYNGAPTKELYSMAGLVLMMEFNDWTIEQAVNEYMWNRKVQLALNIQGHYPEICERTLYRYMKLFAEDNASLAQETMDRVTKVLVEIGEIELGKQRLDSTHIFSNMAIFGRTRMMGIAIKRFLAQVLRHDKKAYTLLDESLRQRYKASQGRLFADTARAKNSDHHRLLRRQVAEDMHVLIATCEAHKTLSNGSSFKALLRIFNEQCEVAGDIIKVRDKTGGNVMQNPSDPDATYDGHKGAGYQSQIAETCDESNEAQMITAINTETAVNSDMDAVEPILDKLKANQMTPESLICDAGYGSDDNVEAAAERGVELVSPTKENADPAQIEKKDTDKLNIDDFVVNEETEEVLCCPAGNVPLKSKHNTETGKTKTIMPSQACTTCEFSDECPVRPVREGFQVEHTSKGRRLASRRREEATDIFARRYRIRAGIESTNSGLKRVTGAGRLRVRGMPRTTMAMALKATGWNILRGTVCSKIQSFIRNRLLRALFDQQFAQKSSLDSPATCLMSILPVFEAKLVLKQAT